MYVDRSDAPSPFASRGDVVGRTLTRIALVVLLLALNPTRAAEVGPATFRRSPAKGKARVSERSVSLALEVSRDGARLLAYTLKDRPFVGRSQAPRPAAYREGGPLQLELVLLGTKGNRFTQRLERGPVCLSHGPEHPPHVAGDTIVLHRDVFIFEVPELPGFDRLELAYYEQSRGDSVRRSLVADRLDRPRFTPAGRAAHYRDLKFADESAPLSSAPVIRSAPMWPEDFGDSDVYRVYGAAAESDERINVVIVPDGYTYAEKELMEAHAVDMVEHFRGKTPYAEHDPLINYVLVYAYSTESGTDECDCGVARATAMGTRFPDTGAPCGSSANRCLYYGQGCDSASTANIAAAELRAPAHDTTVVMVNTGRYGGCGGSRAVFAAGHGQGAEIAIHELGHSLAGLADEYGGTDSCGFSAGEINTSGDAFSGAWAEWINELGPPEEGAQYYDRCLYRPATNCAMRSLNQAFCPVCNQRWSLVLFGHPRVAPTAPLRAIDPDSPATAYVGVPTVFAVETRLAGGGATHQLNWHLQGPSDSEPHPIASGTSSLTHIFDEPGHYELTCEVIADTNFVKPERFGPNVDVAVWSIDAIELSPPPEISPPGSESPLRFLDKQTLDWEDNSASEALSYNVYRGALEQLPGGSYGSCLLADIAATTAEDPTLPPFGSGWFYLITGENPLGEGSLGVDSNGIERSSSAPCE
jgi:hypothetical protein